MLTLFIIIIVIAVIFASQKDKHDTAKDAEAISQLLPFSIRAKNMSTFSKILNLAVNDNELIKTFSYSDGGIKIIMKNGRTVSGQLKDITATFQKISGLTYYEVKAPNGKITFYQTSNISESEWIAINGVLCLSGTTYGKDIFSDTYKRLGYVGTVAKIIKHLN